MSKTTDSVRKPTEAELEVLRALWRQPDATVRDVHALLNRQRPMGYTTVLKTMQIMTEKGLVTRIETERAHRYSAAIAEEAMQRHLLLDLADRLFSGSAAALAMHAISVRPPDASELEQIRALIARKQAEK